MRDTRNVPARGHIIDDGPVRISVVIPTLNEEVSLPRALDSITFDAEILVVDGESDDGTAEVARARRVQLLMVPRGRAAQMNRGARGALGDVLLFLHADCALPKGAAEAIRAALRDSKVVGGAFALAIRSPRTAMLVVAFGSNLRARWLGLPFGDQAIFVRRSVFETLGGFREISLMEDVDFVRRLKREGRIVCLSQKVTTGSRHWQQRGPVVTTLINWVAVALFLLGVSGEWLAPRYFKLRGES